LTAKNWPLGEECIYAFLLVRIIFLILVALLIMSMSIWHSGLIPEGKNYPNLTALAMVFLLLAQLAQLKALKATRNKM
jgi:ABC-type transport system involved in cytochrome bd biosynthesis fused ATPase/permease subunit